MDLMGSALSSHPKVSDSQPSYQKDLISSDIAQHQSGTSSDADHGDEEAYRRTPTPKVRKPQPTLFTEGLDPNSSPFVAPPSAQPIREADMERDPDEESVNLEDFDLHGFTQDEVKSYNSMAEPGQRLQDAVAPNKMKNLMQKTSSQRSASLTSQTPSTIPSIPKQVALFARKHKFLDRVMGYFTKSERRQFERDVYDFAEALGLEHAAAKKQVIKARGFCGEEDYDSDNSALGNEADDSADILKRLAVSSGSEVVVMPSIEDSETDHVKPLSPSRVARIHSPPSMTASKLPSSSKVSPKKSPYFSTAAKVVGAQGKRKRNDEGEKAANETGNPLKKPRRSRGKKRKSATAIIDTSEGNHAAGPLNVTTGAPSGANVDSLDRPNEHAEANGQKHSAMKPSGTTIDQEEPTTEPTQKETDPSKTARKAAKRVRRVKKRTNRDSTARTSQQHGLSVDEPRTGAEAHSTLPGAEQGETNEHNQTIDQTREERIENVESATAIEEHLRKELRSTDEKGIEMYDQAHQNEEPKEPEDNSKDIQARREPERIPAKEVRKAKGKKRKSGSQPLHNDQEPATNGLNPPEPQMAKMTGDVVGKSRRRPRKTPDKQNKEGF